VTYGLTAEGFVEKTADVIDAELAEAQRASPALGPDWDTTAERERSASTRRQRPQKRRVCLAA
jgi:hypothetical protein